MELSAFALVTLSELKAFLNLTDDDTNRDAWLETEIDRTTSQLERFLDRRILARRYREDLNEDYESHTLYLENTPIIAVENVYRDGDRKFDADALIDADEYSVYDDRVELAYQYPYGIWWYKDTNFLRTIRVEYIAGWGGIEIPFTRQRIDLTEETGGDTLTFYIDAGSKTPAEIVSDLNVELNSQGDNERVVSFDWRTRQFKITQEDGDLELITSETNVFADTDSALPLLGFLDANTYDSSPATGDAITLSIPADLKGAVFNIIANRYDTQSYSDNPRRGINSIQLGDYRAEYTDTDIMAAMGYSESVMSVLTQYRRWIIV